MNSSIKLKNEIVELKSKYGIPCEEFVSKVNFENFTNAAIQYNSDKLSESITFGSEVLDKLFTLPEFGTSGIRCGETYEFYGQFRTGKSQICFQLAVTVQLPKFLGGLEKKALYMDTEGKFSAIRIKQIATNIKRKNNWDKDLNDILSSIIFARASTTNEQFKYVERITEILDSSDNEIGIILIDSLTANFRAEYIGREQLIIRQQKLLEFLRELNKIKNKYNIPIVITNQVLSDPKTYGDPIKSAGGNIMAHWANTRCYLRKSKGEKRVIRIVSSPSQDEDETVFKITREGVI